MKAIFTGILIALLTVVFAGIATAQNVKLDSNLQHLYTNIEPIVFVHNSNTCYRLYVWGVYDNGINLGRIHWELRDSTGVDVHNNVVIDGNEIIAGEDYERWDPESRYLFAYIARIKRLTIK